MHRLFPDELKIIFGKHSPHYRCIQSNNGKQTVMEFNCTLSLSLCVRAARRREQFECVLSGKCRCVSITKHYKLVWIKLCMKQWRLWLQKCEIIPKACWEHKIVCKTAQNRIHHRAWQRKQSSELAVWQKKHTYKNTKRTHIGIRKASRMFTCVCVCVCVCTTERSSCWRWYAILEC